MPQEANTTITETAQYQALANDKTANDSLCGVFFG